MKYCNRNVSIEVFFKASGINPKLPIKLGIGTKFTNKIHIVDMSTIMEP